MKSTLLLTWTALVALVLNSTVSFSQATLPNPGQRTWQDMMLDPNANFRETQQKFKDYWEGREVT